MAIAVPGRRLMHALPLRFVRQRVVGGSARPTNASLSLTSMIDFLVVTVVFLLTAFDASARCPATARVTLPPAEHVMELIDAPMVAVAGSQILVDGASAGNTRAIEETRRLQRVDELFNLLKGKRELWKQLHPGRDVPGTVVLQVDQDVPAVVVKSVFQTAAFAGYPNVSFMVSQLPKAGR
jgi:biopolymer transport protein ExbD